MKPDTNNPTAFAAPGLSPTASEAGRNGSQRDNQRQEEGTEELRFDFVPPKQTVTISVRNRIRGRSRPLPYSLDEEAGQ